MSVFSPTPVETFPALSDFGGLVHGFVCRCPDVDVNTDREEALRRLQSAHEEALNKSLGIPLHDCWFGEQVHGDRIAVCPPPDATAGNHILSGMDGLVSATPGTFLGIYVADCCAAFLVDPIRRACGILHSGRKGSELGIVPSAIRLMEAEFGSQPADLVVQLSPCIRPPAYEIDFAAMIRKDCQNAGVPTDRIHDSGVCTGQDLDTYYSYRVEKGRTGRMLAVIGWRDT